LNEICYDDSGSFVRSGALDWVSLTARLHLILAIVTILLVIAHPMRRYTFAVVAAKHFRWAWYIWGSYRTAASSLTQSLPHACKTGKK